MALIPTENEQRYREAPAPALGGQPMPSLDALGGGEAAAGAFGAAERLAMTTVQEAGQLAKEQKDKADQTALYEASTRLSQLQNSLLYDPQTGALKTQGKNAFGIYPDVMGNYQKGAAAIQNDLATDEQKTAFQRQIFARQAEMDHALKVHVAGQTQEYTLGTLKANVEQEGSAALQAALVDPVGLEMALKRQSAALESLAQFSGLSPASAKALQQIQQSKTQLQVIDLMLANGQDLTAKAYYDANKDTLIGQDAIHAAGAVEQGSRIGEANRIVDGWFQQKYKGGILDTPPEAIPIPRTIDELRPKMEAITDPKLRDLVERKTKERLAENRMDEHLAYQDMLQKAADQVERTASTDGLPYGIRTTDLRSLELRARQIRRGEEPVTDDQLYYNLMKEAADPKTRQDFLDRNLMLSRSDLSKHDFDHFVALQAGLIKDDPKSAAVLSAHEIIQKTLVANEVFGNQLPKPGTSDYPRVAAFELAAMQKIRTYETGPLDGKRSATPDEVRALVEGMLLDKATVEGSVWNTERVRGTVLPSENVKPDVTNAPTMGPVPADRVGEITAQLEGRGLRVTEDKIKRMWQASQLGNRQLYWKIANE